MARFDLHTVQLNGRVPAEPGHPLGGRAKKHSSAKTRVEHGVAGRTERPPDQKLGDLGVCVKRPHRLRGLRLKLR